MQRYQHTMADPSFRSEEELYQSCIDSFEMLHDELCEMNHKWENEIKYGKTMIEGRTIHVVGKMYVAGSEHYSRTAVDYVHRTFVPEIEKNRQDWILFREFVDKITINPLNKPIQFYFQELGRMYDLPCEDALADLWAEDTRSYVMEKTKVEERVLDRFIVDHILGFENGADYANILNSLKALEHVFHKPSEYIKDILGEPNTFEAIQSIRGTWHQYSFRRVGDILGKYPERTKVLINTSLHNIDAFAPFGPFRTIDLS